MRGVTDLMQLESNICCGPLDSDLTSGANLAHLSL